MAAVPLRRNRDFMLLQSGQLLSSLGTQSASIAYPLLVLALTHSSAKAGLVAFARTLPLALLALPAGLAADRYDRRRLMIAADALRVLAVGALAVSIAGGDTPFWTIVAAALVEGCGASLFSASQAGALRAVVPAQQLPAAAATQTGRQAAVQLGGAPIGGALFTLAKALPFVLDAVSYALSTASLLLMRTPFQQAREPDRSSLRQRTAEGLRFLWSQKFLRACAFVFGIGNLIEPGLMLCIVVIGRRQRLTGGEIGLLTALFGACVLLGAMLSPLVRRALSPRAILLLELWTAVACAAFLVWPSVYVLTAGILPTGLVIPSTDSVVHGYRIALTPDHLLGRSEAVRSAISLLIAPFGPLLAGVLLEVASPRETVAVFSLLALALAVGGTLSPSIRSAPSLAELDELAARAQA
jgi:MFS family permease